jgi:hypothetical protein
MKLALIPPVSLLDYTLVTDYQLMLPQLIGDERGSQSYNKTYQEHCHDTNTYVILDNGAAEGVNVAPEAFMYIARHWGVDEVVIPDAMGDGIKNVARAIEFMSRRIPQDRERFKFMFVLQGKNWSEFDMNIHWAVNVDWIDTIGIPRHAITTLKNKYARDTLTEKVADMTDKQVHWLGANPEYPTELSEIPPRLKKRIRSTDTSMPFNYAFYEQHLGAELEQPIKRPDNYFGLPRSQFNMGAVEYNVDKLLEWTGE